MTVLPTARWWGCTGVDGPGNTCSIEDSNKESLSREMREGVMDGETREDPSRWRRRRRRRRWRWFRRWCWRWCGCRCWCCEYHRWRCARVRAVWWIPRQRALVCVLCVAGSLSLDLCRARACVVSAPLLLPPPSPSPPGRRSSHRHLTTHLILAHKYF